jgi:hypothetical protein
VGCLGAADEESGSQKLRFDTTVPGLERIREWLRRERVTHVVMESTGSYWVPGFNILEDRFTVLANPEEVKSASGQSVPLWRSHTIPREKSVRHFMDQVRALTRRPRPRLTHSAPITRPWSSAAMGACRPLATGRRRMPFSETTGAARDKATIRRNRWVEDASPQDRTN